MVYNDIDVLMMEHNAQKIFGGLMPPWWHHGFFTATFQMEHKPQKGVLWKLWCTIGGTSTPNRAYDPSRTVVVMDHKHKMV